MSKNMYISATIVCVLMAAVTWRVTDAVVTCYNCNSPASADCYPPSGTTATCAGNSCYTYTASYKGLLILTRNCSADSPAPGCADYNTTFEGFPVVGKICVCSTDKCNTGLAYQCNAGVAATSNRIVAIYDAISLTVAFAAVKMAARSSGI